MIKQFLAQKVYIVQVHKVVLTPFSFIFQLYNLPLKFRVIDSYLFITGNKKV